jgi:hypothetical protein
MSEHEHHGAQQPSEEELRRALEEELRRLTVDDVLLQTTVTLINLAGRKAGLAPGSEGERDLEQVHSAIEAVRALLPVIEPRHGQQLGPIRDALSQLQLAYAREVGEPAATAPPGGEPPGPQEGQPQPQGPGPAQRSGRLWVPGQ